MLGISTSLTLRFAFTDATLSNVESLLELLLLAFLMNLSAVLEAKEHVKHVIQLWWFLFDLLAF